MESDAPKRTLPVMLNSPSIVAVSLQARVWNWRLPNASSFFTTLEEARDERIFAINFIQSKCYTPVPSVIDFIGVTAVSSCDIVW